MFQVVAVYLAGVVCSLACLAPIRQGTKSIWESKSSIARASMLGPSGASDGGGDGSDGSQFSLLNLRPAND